MKTIWIVVLIGLSFPVASAFAVYLYGQFAKRSRGIASFALPLNDEQGELDRLIAPLTREHPEQSGLSLIHDNIDAFAVRALSARRAVRSLDLQYYYWKNDLTGALLANEILQAADRGVRVRLLLDDINATGKEQQLLALDEHDNIDVRLFNPSKNRTESFRRGIEMLLRAFSVTRRMHNKAWIADGRLAIVGGRNIGDAYFDAARQSNFRDMDLLAIGQVVQQSEMVFDNYWNSAVVIPAGKLHCQRRKKLPKLRKKLLKTTTYTRYTPYLQCVIKQTATHAPLLRDKIYWTDRAQMLADPPEKAYAGRQQSWLMNQFKAVSFNIKKQLHIISPYFIPGTQGSQLLQQLVNRGIDVAVLTNSLAATDVTAVHGAYLNYRKPLLKSGIRLFELKGKTDRRERSLFGSGGASLHTKAFYIDNQLACIGSFNFDPRSASLNTEMGILFSQPELIAEMQQIFAIETAPAQSYRVTFRHNRLFWSDQHRGRIRLQKQEPQASMFRKIAARIISWLPVESQL